MPFRRLAKFSLILSIICLVAPVIAESPEEWYRSGREAVESAKNNSPINTRAKNVILFVGDGMGISTVTAARIFAGQSRGGSGEEGLLSFERWQNTALIKTYNTDQQVSDSAGTMSAMVTGIKTKAGVLSVNQNATRGDHKTAEGNSAATVLELAEEAGLSTGIVTNTAVTHATPAACYAHAPERNWGDDSLLSDAARADGFSDIARQLIEFDHGNGIEVVFGGGRRNFLPVSTVDPEYKQLAGQRLDGRDLIAEWAAKRDGRYIWNSEQFDHIDKNKASPILALFEPNHMRFEHDRHEDKDGEPSLSDMVAKAVAILSSNPKGFFLMVEGGRIDHAHHLVNAYRALSETVEFARAVEAAENRTDRNDTLIIVTADHSHVFTMGGYPKRGHPILGKVVQNAPSGSDEPLTALDRKGRPFTTLGYANGPLRQSDFADDNSGDLRSVDTTDPDYHQHTGIDLPSETHGGEDVPLYADGPQAHLFRGVLEQHVIFHVMAEALGLNQNEKNVLSAHSGSDTQGKSGAAKSTADQPEPAPTKGD